jgi:hypothetical protein
MVDACNPSTWEAEADLEFKANLDYIWTWEPVSKETINKQKQRLFHLLFQKGLKFFIIIILFYFHHLGTSSCIPLSYLAHFLVLAVLILTEVG